MTNPNKPRSGRAVTASRNTSRIASKSAAKPERKSAAKPRKRTPGRPRTDAPDQRERLLDAALACFVRKGIAATSLRDIAAESGVTPALAHYYFGDKSQLLEAVIETRAMPAFLQVRERVAAAGDDVADVVGAIHVV